MILIVDVKSGRFGYQSGRAGDEAKKRKSLAKSGRVGISVFKHVKEKASEASAKHVGVGGGVCE